MSTKNLLITVFVLLGAGVLGLALMKFAIGLIVFLLFGAGAFLGFMVAKLIYKKEVNHEN